MNKKFENDLQSAKMLLAALEATKHLYGNQESYQKLSSMLQNDLRILASLTNKPSFSRSVKDNTRTS